MEFVDKREIVHAIQETLSDYIDEYEREQMDLETLATTIYHLAVDKYIISLRERAKEFEKVIYEIHNNHVNMNKPINEGYAIIKREEDVDCLIKHTCDDCREFLYTKKLKLPQKAGTYLCKDCWNKEMGRRALRNMDLDEENWFDILMFEMYDCKTYNPDKKNRGDD